jgi:hypothetical protein
MSTTMDGGEVERALDFPPKFPQKKYETAPREQEKSVGKKGGA